MTELKGRALGAICLGEFLDAIDERLLLNPIRFQVRDKRTGQLTTYYINRDRHPGESTFPEKAQ